MLRILLILILARSGNNDQPSKNKYVQPQRQQEVVEFGDCVQLPHQKTLGE